MALIASLASKNLKMSTCWPSTPARKSGMKVTWAPSTIRAADGFASPSPIVRPVIFGNQ